MKIASVVLAVALLLALLALPPPSAKTGGKSAPVAAEQAAQVHVDLQQLDGVAAMQGDAPLMQRAESGRQSEIYAMQTAPIGIDPTLDNHPPDRATRADGLFMGICRLRPQPVRRV